MLCSTLSLPKDLMPLRINVLMVTCLLGPAGVWQKLTKEGSGFLTLIVWLTSCTTSKHHQAHLVSYQVGFIDSLNLGGFL